MLIEVPNHHFDRPTLAQLRQEADAARHAFFHHSDPGGLTPAEKEAWEMDHDALALLLKAAERRLQAEIELAHLITLAETGAHG